MIRISDDIQHLLLVEISFQTTQVRPDLLNLEKMLLGSLWRLGSP